MIAVYAVELKVQGLTLFSVIKINFVKLLQDDI